MITSLSLLFLITLLKRREASFSDFTHSISDSVSSIVKSLLAIHASFPYSTRLTSLHAALVWTLTVLVMALLDIKEGSSLSAELIKGSASLCIRTNSGVWQSLSLSLRLLGGGSGWLPIFALSEVANRKCGSIFTINVGEYAFCKRLVGKGRDCVNELQFTTHKTMKLIVIRFEHVLVRTLQYLTTKCFLCVWSLFP